VCISKHHHFMTFFLVVKALLMRIRSVLPTLAVFRQTWIGQTKFRRKQKRYVLQTHLMPTNGTTSLAAKPDKKLCKR